MRGALLILMLAAGPLVAGEPPLRAAVTESWEMPLVRIEQGRVTDGLFHDLYQRLSEKVGRRIDMLPMPRRRIEEDTAHGEIDLRCYVNPAWVNESGHRYAWSLPFMTQRDLLVARRAALSIEAPQDLHDERIGTVLGFAYPTLEPLFASGQLTREDARTQEQVLHMLAAGRLDYAVSNALSLHWYNRAKPASRRLAVLAEVASEPISCMVLDAPGVPTKALLRALMQMSEAGEIEAILARYR